MGSGWPMFSENTLMLYQQDLQLVPYFVKWQLASNPLCIRKLTSAPGLISCIWWLVWRGPFNNKVVLPHWFYTNLEKSDNFLVKKINIFNCKGRFVNLLCMRNWCGWCLESVYILRTDHRSTSVIDDQFLFGDILCAVHEKYRQIKTDHVHIYPSPCASHIMCCVFFIKFLDNTCRNKVEIIMETQKVYLLIKHR